MRTSVWLVIVSLSGIVFGACRRQEPKPDFRPMVSIEEIMESMVMPRAGHLWDSVATVVSVTGTEERQPKTQEEWDDVRHDAVSVMESMNLIMMEGRRAARNGAKSENPGIELEPAEIEKLIADDRPALYNLAHKEQEAAAAALAAIDKKDVQGLLDAGEQIDTACENCHLKYWYPNDPFAKKAAARPKP
jgi:hypothetical protein